MINSSVNIALRVQSRGSNLGRTAWKRMDTSLAAKFTPTIKLHLGAEQRNATQRNAMQRRWRTRPAPDALF